MRARLLIAGLGVIALAVTGCTSSASTAAPQAAPAAASTEHNDADIKFSQEMIPHHQQTIRVADIATRRSSNEQVKVVAASILAAEAAEIKKMSAWLNSWGQQVPLAGGHAGHDMPGMLSSQDIATLEAAKPGADFDQKWLKMVVQHLRNGVTMANDIVKNGKHTETIDLARHIAENQGQQIKEINALLV
jgi:uncharacterized protein (DUF305 family)